MKRMIVSVALFLSAQLTMAADIKLPEPQKQGGKPVLEAVAARASVSGRTFPTGKISNEELSTLLWAATGKNRDAKWTVPFGMGLEPYVAIYVAGPEGLYRYSWQENTLKQIVAEDVRAKVGSQPFIAIAPYVFIFTSDKTSMKHSGRVREEWVSPWINVAVGAMTQQLYLVGDALGIGARYVQGFEPDFIRKAVKLPDDEQIVCIFPMGKR